MPIQIQERKSRSSFLLSFETPTGGVYSFHHVSKNSFELVRKEVKGLAEMTIEAFMDKNSSFVSLVDSAGEDLTSNLLRVNTKYFLKKSLLDD